MNCSAGLRRQSSRNRGVALACGTVLLVALAAGVSGCGKREEPVAAAPGGLSASQAAALPQMEPVAIVYGSTYLVRHFDAATGFLCYGYDSAQSSPSCTKVAPARTLPAAQE